jgi:hypothetical protein
VRTRAAASPRALRAAGPAIVSVAFFLEGGCSSGRPASASRNAEAPAGAAASPSPPFKEIPSSVLAAYDAGRIRAWDPGRRFKALFKAEASPKIGAVGRGWLSVWWDGASGSLAWRSSAPIAGGGRGGYLKKVKGGGGDPDFESPVPGHLAAADLIACILGTPDAPASPSLPFEETPRGLRLRIDDSNRSALIDRDGRPTELVFPGGEVVKLQPGDGVPRRIEANGPHGRAVLTLENYGPWPPGEEVPPP